MRAMDNVGNAGRVNALNAKIISFIFPFTSCNTVRDENGNPPCVINERLTGRIISVANTDCISCTSDLFAFSTLGFKKVTLYTPIYERTF